MISRRNFLAGAIAAAVAPSVAPELARYEFGRLDTFRFISSNQTVLASTINDAMNFGVGHVAMPAYKAEQRRKNAILRAMLDNAHLAANPPRIQPYDGGPTIEYIAPTFDPSVLYHFDQPNGRCPDEMTCHFCKFNAERC